MDKVDLNIQPKEFVSIVGQSGAGKTTLIKLVIGEEKPDSGKVFVDGVEVNSLKPTHLPNLRKKISTVFQDFKLLTQKNVFENIAFALEAVGRTDKEIYEDVPKVLSLVGIADKTDCFPYQLSGGEKQRVSIARALALRPEILIADEPTGNLDPINSFDILRLLYKINELGTTVILATHNKELVNALGKRVVTLEKGKVIRDQEEGKYML